VPREARPINFFSPNIILNRKRRIIISKEKKEKKKAVRSSGGFQKSKFFRKNTTPDVIEKEVRFIIDGIQLKM
jgi:hypothetical protein